MAALLRNVEMVRLLQQYNAKESSACKYLLFVRPTSYLELRNPKLGASVEREREREINYNSNNNNRTPRLNITITKGAKLSKFLNGGFQFQFSPHFIASIFGLLSSSHNSSSRNNINSVLNTFDSTKDLSREGRANQLYSLYTEARQLVEDLSRPLQAILPNDQQQELPAQDVVAEQEQQQLPASELIGRPCEPLMLATGSLLSSALYEVSTLKGERERVKLSSN